jgi:hypothetical protein
MSEPLVKEWVEVEDLLYRPGDPMRMKNAFQHVKYMAVYRAAEVDALLQQRDEQLATRKGWQTCSTHGSINADVAWGCPECVRELRNRLAAVTAERDVLRKQVQP